MKPILSLLDAAFPVFFHVIRGNLLKLAAVFLPVNLLLSHVHSQIALRFAPGGDIPLEALKNSGAVERVYGLIVGLFAFVIAVRATWSAIESPTDRNEPYGTENDAWRRAFGTQLIFAAAVVAAAAAPYVAFLMCKEVHFAGLIAGGAVLCLGVILILRLCLAAHLSALFHLGPVMAVRESFAITRRHVGRLFAFTVLAGLVAAALTAIPAVLYFGDVLGFIHPFSTENSTLRLIGVIVHAVLGTSIAVLQLFPATALTLFLRERLEGPSERPAANPARLGLLVAFGLAFLAVISAACLTLDGNVDDNRRFRMENMDTKFRDVTVYFNIPLLHRFGGHRVVGNAYVEKRMPLDFDGDRLLWHELPFCSNCRRGSCVRPDGCSRHEPDTYAYKHIRIIGGNDSASTACGNDVFTLLPTDVQRPMTEEEKTRVNDILKSFDATNAVLEAGR